MAGEIPTGIVSVKHYLNKFDVQSGPCGDMMQRRGSSNGVGNGVACGLEQTNQVT